MPCAIEVIAFGDKEGRARWRRAPPIGAPTPCLGRGHYAMAMAALCTMAVRCVHCAGGISHYLAEAIALTDADAAVRVLLNYYAHAGPERAMESVMSQAIERNVRAFLDAEQQAQVRFLAEIVKIPTDNPPGDCGPAAERVAKLIEPFGWDVERHLVPPDIVKAAGMISCTNLIVRRIFGPGTTVALNAHGDVVPPGIGWTCDPYGAKIKDGWMYGRGAAVSKSDFATYVWALRALEASGARLGGTVELHLTYDEETGGEIGPGYLLAEGLSKPDLAIGAGFSYAVPTPS